MGEKISIVVVDDHVLVRSALEEWLHNEPDMAVVGRAGTAEEAIEVAMQVRPQVVLMDIDMPGLICFDAVRTMSTTVPEARVIILSGFVQDCYIEQALAAKVMGYLTKCEVPQKVAAAVREVAAGGAHFSDAIRSRIVVDSAGVKLAAEPMARASLLTPREMEVLRYLARGLSKKEIAGTMHLSVKTIDRHCTNLMNKLDIHDRVGLARFAIREGMSQP